MPTIIQTISSSTQDPPGPPGDSGPPESKEASSATDERARQGKLKAKDIRYFNPDNIKSEFD